MMAADGAAMEAVVDLMASVLAIMAAALAVTIDKRSRLLPSKILGPWMGLLGD